MRVRTNGYRSWKKSLVFASAALAALSIPAFAQDDEDVEEIEGFVVTGSRIKQLDLQTVNPVLRLDADAIEATGFTTIGDAVRSLPFNNGQALTPTDSGTSFTSGVSTVNLRGLGNNNTLVLINGRRAAPYAAPGFNGFQTVFDLNSIPEGAIENIEIQKDGASAIYGSDAVAGVMNVTLATDYEGASVSGQIGNYFSTDGFQKKAAFITGANTAKTSVVMSLNWAEQNGVFGRDLPFVAADQGFRANDSMYWIVEGFDGTLDDYIDALGWLPDTPAAWEYADNRSSRAPVGYLNSPSTGTVTFSGPTNNPTAENATSARNFYDYTEMSGMYPEYRQFAFYTYGKHQIADNLYAFAEVSFSRMESQVHSAPTPVDIETSNGLSPGTRLTYPSYNAYNPWGVDFTNGRRRLYETGNRVNDVKSDTPRILVGLGGDLENDMIEDWTWEVGAMYTKNTVDNLNRGTIPDYRLQMAFNGLTELGDGSLSWDPNTPQEDRVYFNWFGENSSAMADFLTVENPNSAYLEYRSFDANTSGRLPALELPGGTVAFNVGVERRIEDFGNVKSDLNATGNVLGGSEGTSSFGNRTLNSVFAEVQIPVLDELEFQVAGRWEDYSDDGFEQDIRPKVGVLFRPVEWLSVRATFSESFKAPDLAYLYTASQTSFSSNQLIDPVTGSEIDQLQIVTAGNPNLRPEVSDTYYLGITFEPTGKLEGFRAFVDILKWDQQDLLAQLSDFYGYPEFLSAAADPNDENHDLFAGAVARDSATNEVLYIRDDYANISSGEYLGYDFGFGYRLETEYGDWYAQFNSTYLKEILIDGSDIVGGYLTPEWRHTLTVNYTYGDWGANLTGVYIDGRTRTYSFGSQYDGNDTLYFAYDVDEQYVWNAQVSYSGLMDTRIVVGVNNVFDDAPPPDAWQAAGSTPGVNYTEPAFWYVRMERDF